MQNERKNRLISYGFAAVLLLVFFANLIKPDAELSVSERRRLAQLPESDAQALLSGEFFADLEQYALDQFIARDELRTLKALFRLGVLGQLENNEMFVEKGGIYKQLTQMNGEMVRYNARKLAAVASEHFPESRVFWTVVPDKVMLLGGREGQSVPLEGFVENMAAELGGQGYIDLSDTLEVADYYRTDPHWSQERIIPAADRLLTAMTGTTPKREGLTVRKAGEFFGAYHGRLPIVNEPDELFYLTGGVIDRATVFDYETSQRMELYRPDLFGGLDPYDFYLAGARALLRIDVPNAESKRELVVIRDSFGSSLAPLLLEGYSSVYLIDLRYISPLLLDELIPPTTAQRDVLMILSALIIEQAGVFR